VGVVVSGRLGANLLLALLLSAATVKEFFFLVVGGFILDCGFIMLLVAWGGFIKF